MLGLWAYTLPNCFVLLRIDILRHEVVFNLCPLVTCEAEGFVRAGLLPFISSVQSTSEYPLNAAPSLAYPGY